MLSVFTLKLNFRSLKSKIKGNMKKNKNFNTIMRQKRTFMMHYFHSFKINYFQKVKMYHKMYHNLFAI